MTQLTSTLHTKLTLEQLVEVINTVPGAVCYYRWNGTSLEPIVVSQQYSRMLGVKDASEVLNRTKDINFLHVHPEDLPALQKAVIKAIEEVGTLTYTYRSYNESLKKYLWLNLQGRMVLQEDGYKYAYVVYSDVTKTKEMEEQLREKEQMLEEATIAAGIWYWNYNWKTDTGEFGLQLQADLKLPAVMPNFATCFLERELILPEYKQKIYNAFMKIRNGAIQTTTEFQLKRPDGSVNWCRCTMTNLSEQGQLLGKAIGAVVIIDDVKELEGKYLFEKTRKKLNAGNAMGTAVYNLTQQIMLEFEGKQVVPGLLSAQTIDEIGKRIALYIPNPEERRAYLDLHKTEKCLADYEAGKLATSFDYRVQQADGHTRWVRAVLHLIKDPKTKDIVLFDYCYDINKKKVMEMLANFAVNDDYDLVGAVYFKDARASMIFGKNSFNILGVNYVEEDYDESMKRFALNAVLEADREEYMRKACLSNITQVLQQQSSYEFYIRAYIKGELCDKKVCYIRSENDPELVFFTQTDITVLLQDEKRKQERLQAAVHAAEFANQSKSTFLSQMSHEIRTPMNALIGMTNLALDSSSLDEKDDYLRKIDSSSHFLLGILNDILDMSRIESGKFELHKEWVRGNSILEASVNMLKLSCQQKGIEFSYPTLEPNDIEYYADRLRSQQVLMNLLNNAIKFTPTGGSIKLTLEILKEEKGIRWNRIRVQDTGCGMSPAFLKRVFSPFEQEQNPYSATVQGTGLGLALVKKIVTCMGGEINVESTLGQGSTFTVLVPYQYRIATEKTSARPEQKKDEALLKGKRVLLVDDHPLNREIARKLMERKGLVVEEAVDGLEALEKFTASALDYYSVILMDIKMPRLNGLETSTRLRALDRPDAKTIPILAMTANAFESDRKESVQAGMNAHLSKPIEPQLLYASLLEYCK